MTHPYPNYAHNTGLSNVGSYQVSGKPFLTGGVDPQVTEKIEFPSVTRWIYISSSVPVKVGMSDDGAAGTNYFTVDTANGQNLPVLELKCTELYLNGGQGKVDIVAGLTGIAIDRINNISPSGTNWAGTPGIGVD